MASIAMLIRGALGLSPEVPTCFQGCPRMTSIENERDMTRNRAAPKDAGRMGLETARKDQLHQ